MDNFAITVLGQWAIEAFEETTSFLIDVGPSKILLDACPGVCRQLHRASTNLTHIDVALVSHVHADHLLGLPYFIFARTAAARSSTVAVPPLKVFANPETIAAAKTLLHVCYPERKDFLVEWRSLAANEQVELGPCRIASFPVLHTVPTTAFRVTYTGKAIAYTSDTSPIEGLSRFCQGVDLLVVEAFGLRKDFSTLASKQQHLLVEEACELAVEAKAKRALLFHMHLPYKERSRQEEFMDNFRKKFSGESIFPTEFLRIEV